jgi:DNA-binding beta-propeller fold protein YncE
MRRIIPSHILLVGLCLGLLFAYGCWGDQRAPAEGDLAAEAFEPQFAALTADSMASPVRLATTPRGRLLVSDARRGMILSVDPVTLRADQGFQVEGRPLAIGLIGKRVFVGNVSKRTIEVYDAHGGSLQRSFGPGAVEHPTDLAVDDVLGLIFVLDGGTKQVKVFDTRGVSRGTISGPGTGAEWLQVPTAIAVDRVAREVLISDYGTPGDQAAVKIFDYDGNYLTEISGAGDCGMMGCTGGFSRPQGLEVDGQGRVYLVDALLAQVLVFDRGTLELVNTLGGRSGSPGLRVPLDVTIGIDGDLFVTSNRTRTVEVFYGGANPR